MLLDNYFRQKIDQNNNTYNYSVGNVDMIEQSARVISTRSGYAWVMPEQAVSCGGCATKSSCGKATDWFNFLKPKAEKLYAVNPLHAKPGDTVIIGTQANTLVLYSLLAYLLPLLSLLIFAILSSAIAERMGWTGEGAAILAGLAGLLSGFRLAAWLAKRIAHTENSQPVILRHKEKAVSFTLHALNSIRQ